MENILGIDLGTNSIGWAITERHEEGFLLKKSGVDIFQEGVAHEKNEEKPSVALRTASRGVRRHYFRRRLRKIEVLKVLVKAKLCPPLTDEMLEKWRYEKIYPLDEAFMNWQRTSDNEDKNPYHNRYEALTRKLDMSCATERYLLGRALYHLSQRRGFLSNRKDTTEDSDGKVQSSIDEIDREMEAMGCEYLGEYFYRLHLSGEKVRGKYTSRNSHYRKEFEAICRKQQLSEELSEELRRAIFFQRPLKSQKGSVGKCTFERTKSRCSVSHPLYEEFRMLSLLNNIRIRTRNDSDYRPLTEEEKNRMKPKFFRKSKDRFDFKELAKELCGKRISCGFRDDKEDLDVRFNYRMSASVSGCPVTAGLMDVFGEDWLPSICSVYQLSAGKTEEEILQDVWHALFSFDDNERLRKWAELKLQLTSEQSDKFAKIRISREYASLSRKAIARILPYLRVGLRYDEAVFCGNLQGVVPADVWSDRDRRRLAEEGVVGVMSDLRHNPTMRGKTNMQVISDYLREVFPDETLRCERLYHPSMIETYQKAEPNGYGLRLLGSPRTQSVKNPMAMRALFRLRALVNQLLRDGDITPETKINIEFARGLNDANRRKAIMTYQEDARRRREKYADAIKEFFLKETGKEILPSDDDVLKYQLWEEQGHICLYTGAKIGLADFLGPNPKYDIEHTVPRSRGGDNSQENKTLCDKRFNREIKGAKLPAELACHAEVMDRVEVEWLKKIDALSAQIARKKGGGGDKASKDRRIVERHRLTMERDYWRGKLRRFTMTDVPEGFSLRQGVDIGIIGKYARLYLQTVFDKTYVVKGATTAAFRKMWGLQDDYSKKERVNHTHHCIDAITIACIGKREYDSWAQYERDSERYERGLGGKPSFKKPWPTFTEDVKSLVPSLLVSHHTPDNARKATRKLVRIRGKVRKTADGRAMVARGDSARLSLHQQTFYGAILKEGEVKYVVRKALSLLQPSDVDRIVDPEVRAKVQTAVEAKGFKEAMAGEIWMNEQKRIPIKKVRIFTPNVVAPIRLKKHRDESAFNHKRHYHVANDGNYCMAVYEGTDNKGQRKRTSRVVNNLDAAGYFKRKARGEDGDLVPMSDDSGNPLLWILRTGTMVLFYEHSPEELFNCDKSELSKRLYKIVGMSTMTISGRYQYGILTLRHHQEARQSSLLSRAKKGLWKEGEDYRPLIGVNHNQLNFLVSGYDFDLSLTGEIKFKQ